MGVLQGEVFCKIPFRVCRRLSAKQMVSDDEEEDDEQNGKKSAANKKGQQHADCNPEQNKTQHFSHGNPSKTSELL